MGRLFGTDGVRGLANETLTAELALRIAGAAAQVLAESDGQVRPTAVLGRDPRASGEMLSAAVTAGLTAAGVDVLDIGVVPTPAVAYLTDAYAANLGVMISASHNPMPDNGIKIFAAGGHKLDDDAEDRIEAVIESAAVRRPTGEHIGRARFVADAGAKYLEHLAVASPQSLAGIKVVVDCANGAASTLGPAAYRAAGAEVIAINADPNGLNINEDCGSTHMSDLQKAVVAHGAHAGIAHDGDADRCLAVDATGTLVDGDAIMAVLALAMKESGELTDDTLVATVMSNLGLHIAMRAAGIELRTTAVGDRYVLEELRSGAFALGGEQSGHVVLPRFSTTGDGLLTALRLLGQVASTGKTLAELAGVLTVLPQVLVNVRVSDKAAVAAAPTVADAVAEAERELGENGRVLLRPSGTEELVRVMVEAADLGHAQRLADRLAEHVGAI
ncbi:phosphoglucosamine mutase [Antrihabitans sp. YC2-6]|uniref:phosphoglucosamine mutase n=1 Tax=Antrihabitans sp. YC2-6 TaxID=2799498 RepID=UPI0018F46DE0|nr:phosphoglucosamine mutase [Antrihabitans sp. YC2-6]MBJ8347448.1 phosphoglucosamine mutase [Antrihabitans sp. YC2-6]